jgi:DNA-binding NarL/FixJ family response regulator
MSANAKRVFIVDDSPIVRERLVRLVNELPQATVVGEAAQPAEAIYEIRRLQPDLVILDISMPGGSGMHVLETVKKDAPEIKIIMLTNFAYDQYRDKCCQLGADYFFDKSTEFQQIAQVIQDTAHQSQAA